MDPKHISLNTSTQNHLYLHLSPPSSYQSQLLFKFYCDNMYDTECYHAIPETVFVPIKNASHLTHIFVILLISCPSFVVIFYTNNTSIHTASSITHHHKYLQQHTQLHNCFTGQTRDHDFNVVIVCNTNQEILERMNEEREPENKKEQQKHNDDNNIST